MQQILQNPIAIILAILVAAIAWVMFEYDKSENYSQAALIQLFAKGPQDTYLTGDAWKYIPPFYYYGWPYAWNMPTRVRKSWNIPYRYRYWW